MKWFKHYTNANTSHKLNTLIDKYGLEGYARYWLLVELLAEKFNGNDPTFELHFDTIRQRLRGYHAKIVRRFLGDIDNLKLMSVQSSDNVYVIYFPKLLEIKDNHTKNLQVKTKSVTPRKEKKRTEKKASKFDIDAIYNAYPKKVGKKIGYEKLTQLIKTQEQFDNILLGAKNYKASCVGSGTEMRYIKQFSTWVNQEGWNDNYNINIQSEADTEKELRLFLDQKIAEHEAAKNV